MIKRPIWTWLKHTPLRRLINAFWCWIRRRPKWDLPASAKWLVYSGLFMYNRNQGSPDGIWEWGDSLFGIPVPTLTSTGLSEGLVGACLLASFIFLIEPLLPTSWSNQTRAARKEANWIMIDGILSLAAYALGMLPILSSNSDWWGGELVLALGMLLFFAMPIKTVFDVRNAYKRKHDQKTPTCCEAQGSPPTCET